MSAPAQRDKATSEDLTKRFKALHKGEEDSINLPAESFEHIPPDGALNEAELDDIHDFGQY